MDTSNNENGKEMFVTPWDVKGEIDYNKLITQFGTSKITPEILERMKTHANGKLHFMLRRGLFFSHRDLDWLLDWYDNGNPFVLYTGRGPSGPVHIGHMIPWMFTKWLQDVYDVDLYFQFTDDEKFLFKPDITLNETTKWAYENAKDVLAIGFNPEKTHFIFDTLHGPKFYNIATRIAKKITFSTVKAVFGFTNSSNIGMIYFPAFEATPCFYPSELEGRPIPVLIPAAIDQDPFWRVTRDIAGKLGYLKPTAIHAKFAPGLEAGGKMSSSNPNSAIYSTDSPKVAKKKVMRAYTGGRATIKEQKELGGVPEVCNVFKFFKYVFEENDDKLREREQACKAGELMCGPCKTELANRFADFLVKHQEKREDVADLIPNIIIRE